MCSPRPATISIVVLNPGCECLTGKLWLNFSMRPKRLGSSRCQSRMKASLICACSGVIGGRIFGHLPVGITLPLPLCYEVYMTRKKGTFAPDLYADPFGERS